jgi:hypothetical protein
MSKWIEFQERPRPNWQGVTKIWHVTSKEGNDFLGVIKWYSPWRKYCFQPYGNTVYEQDCLRDIATFIETQTKEHREKKKYMKRPALISASLLILFALTFAACQSQPSRQPRDGSAILRGKHHTGNAQVSWQPLTGAVRYRIYWGPASNKTAHYLTVGTSAADTTGIVTGLRVGNTYYFSVAGIDASGIPGALSTPIALLMKAGINKVEVP